MIHVYLTFAITDADEHLEAFCEASLVISCPNIWSTLLMTSFLSLFILKTLLHPYQLLQKSQFDIYLSQEFLCF